MPLFPYSLSVFSTKRLVSSGIVAGSGYALRKASTHSCFSATRLEELAVAKGLGVSEEVGVKREASMEGHEAKLLESA